ncbi:MAG: cytochrome C [Gammaproteobacteria bacterium]|nr:MAG: cytochrome C [Gammaproteobacteria bacterium]
MMKTLVLSTALLLSALALAEGEVPYPDGYRTWNHVKSMVIKPGHALANPFQGIHHVYANDKALRGLRSGKYPDGAVLVFDLLHYVDKDAALTEGDRKLVGVMVRDRNRYRSTGGWGFEGFAGNSRVERLTSDGGASCFSCHQSQESQGYVFSQWRP